MDRKLIVEETEATVPIEARHHQMIGEGRVRIGRVKPIGDFVILDRLLLQREAVQCLPFLFDPSLLLQMHACADEAEDPVWGCLRTLMIET